jgi:hypothetical protein
MQIDLETRIGLIASVEPTKAIQLFVSERHHRIYAHSSPRWQVGSEERDA